MVASIKSKDFIVYYTNKLEGREREKGIGTKMRVKLAAKMLIIVWTYESLNLDTRSGKRTAESNISLSGLDERARFVGCEADDLERHSTGPLT